MKASCRWCGREFTDPGQRHCPRNANCDWCASCVNAKREAAGLKPA